MARPPRKSSGPTGRDGRNGGGNRRDGDRRGTGSPRGGSERGAGRGDDRPRPEGARSDRPRADRSRPDSARSDSARSDRPRDERARADRGEDRGVRRGARPGVRDRADQRTGEAAPRGRSAARTPGAAPRSAERAADRPRPSRDGARADAPRAERRRPDGPRGEGRRAEGSRPYGPRSDTAQRRPEATTRPARKAPPAAAPTPRDPSLPSREGERIAKLLARAGIASRREAERLIEEGRVKLGDTVIDTPATVLTTLKGVTVDGKPVKAAEETRLFAFHKPAGLLTAERDPAGRPTIYTALRNALPPGTGRVMPIGRLDLNTEGLLLLTNDGEFKRQLELPATGVPRTYRARTFGDITQARLEELMEGIEVDGVVYGRIDANMERRTGRNQWIEMTLTEGKNREVRRVLEALGLQVSRLIRVAYGPFVLGEMPKGSAGEVPAKHLEAFRRTLDKGGDRTVKP